MDTGVTSKGPHAASSWLRWITPPRELPRPTPVARRLIDLLWFACLIFAVGVQIVANTFYVERVTKVEPAFAALGLTVDDTDRRMWAVLPNFDETGFSPWAGFPTTIDGRDITGLPPEAVANMIAGPDGGVVAMGMLDLETEQVMVRRLVRSEANQAAVYRENQRPLMLGAAVFDVILAVALVAGGVLLRWRRFDQPVAMVFSFALLLLATVGTTIFWERLHFPEGEAMVDAAWLALFLVGIPALPNGRYTPSWARWFMVVGPVGGLILGMPHSPVELSETARVGLLAAAFACVVIRFRYTPRGIERQQMKWACLGLAAGLILYLLSQVAKWVVLLPDVLGTVLVVLIWAEFILHRSAFTVMGAGVLVALLNYRLNDADAAIGRSTGYAVVTGVIAITWAFGAAWIDTTLTLVTGASNPTLATGLSTLAAMAILAPAQTRVLAWMESRFQRALVRLRDLPARLARLRHHADPHPVADTALKAVVEGVNATQAALVAEGEAGLRVLAVHGLSEERVLADMLLEADHRRLAVRYPLRDMDEHVGWLLLGPRSDGASYSGDERRALHLILDPLADAIRLTTRRHDETAALKSVIAAMEARVARVEAERTATGRARRPARPRRQPA